MSEQTASETPLDDTMGTGAELHYVSMAAESNGAHASDAPERSARPRASARRAAKEISAFGAIPADCTAWGVKRQTRSGGWEPCSYGEGEVETHEWPLSELSHETIQARWGAGTFKTQWWKPGPGGGRKFIAQGTPVTYKAPAAAAPPASSPAAPDPLTAHLDFMRLISAEAETKIQSTLALARALSGSQQPAGISATDLLSIVREERQAAAEALRAATEAQAAQTAAQIAALEARLAAREDEDEDEGSALEAAAAAALSAKKKTGGFLGFLGAVAEHKDLIKEALPLVIGALSTVNEGLKTAQQAAHVSAAQRQQVRPQATARGPVVDVVLQETELEREQREAYERATAPLSEPPRQAAPQWTAADASDGDGA